MITIAMGINNRILSRIKLTAIPVPITQIIANHPIIRKLLHQCKSPPKHPILEAKKIPSPNQFNSNLNSSLPLPNQLYRRLTTTTSIFSTSLKKLWKKRPTSYSRAQVLITNLILRPLNHRTLCNPYEVINFKSINKEIPILTLTGFVISTFNRKAQKTSHHGKSIRLSRKIQRCLQLIKNKNSCNH